MKTEVSYNQEHEIYLIAISGIVSSDDIQNASQLLDGDLSEAKFCLLTHDISDLPKTKYLFHGIASLSYSARISIVANPESSLLRKLQFVEMTAFQKGKTIEIFETKELAFEWLNEE